MPKHPFSMILGSVRYFFRGSTILGLKDLQLRSQKAFMTHFAYGPNLFLKSIDITSALLLSQRYRFFVTKCSLFVIVVHSGFANMCAQNATGLFQIFSKIPINITAQVQSPRCRSPIFFAIADLARCFLLFTMQDRLS